MWKIFYEDGSVFSSEDGDFMNAPAFGVIALVADDETRFRQVDFVGLVDLMVSRPLYGVKVGRMTTNDIYAAVMDKARNDKDFTRDRVVMERSDYYVRI